MADLDLQSLGMRLGEAITPTPRDAPQVRYGTVAAVNADGTLDVTVDGTTLRGMCATTGCVGASAGMRCLVLRQGALATVVGLVANTDLADVSAAGAAFTGGLTLSDPASWRAALGVADNAVLWTGGMYMSDQHTIALSQNVLDQPHGIILAWSYYNGTPKDYNFNYTYVPKWHVKDHVGCGVDCVMATPSLMGHKYVYVSNASITGHADNTGNHTIAGVACSNSNFVLRAVLGV